MVLKLYSTGKVYDTLRADKPFQRLCFSFAHTIKALDYCHWLPYHSKPARRIYSFNQHQQYTTQVRIWRVAFHRNGVDQLFMLEIPTVKDFPRDCISISDWPRMLSELNSVKGSLPSLSKIRRKDVNEPLIQFGNVL